MTTRVTVSLGLFLCALCLTGLALLLRRYAPGRYGDFWQVWGEPPRLWLTIAASQLVVVSPIDVGGSLFPEQARVIMGVMGFGSLIVGGSGVWWLLRTTTLREPTPITPMRPALRSRSESEGDGAALYGRVVMRWQSPTRRRGGRGSRGDRSLSAGRPSYWRRRIALPDCRCHRSGDAKRV